MSDVRDWSPVDANNNAAPPDGFPERMPAGSVNDSSRAVMGGVRRQWEDGGWFDYGHAVTYVSADTFQVPGDLSAVYYTGRRVRASGGANDDRGTIATVSVSGNTDVTVTWDGAGLVTAPEIRIAVAPDPTTLPPSQTFEVVPDYTKDVSGLALVEFNESSLYNSGYTRLRFEFDNLQISEDGNDVALEIMQNASYLPTYASIWYGVDGAGLYTDFGGAIGHVIIANGVSSGSGRITGVAHVTNLDAYVQAYGRSSYFGTGTNYRTIQYSGGNNGASSPVQSVKFSPKGGVIGTFVSGVIRVYGTK